MFDIFSFDIFSSIVLTSTYLVNLFGCFSIFLGYIEKRKTEIENKKATI